jgi:peptidoglycan/LPS O-acetylase OafA/YrhL
MVHDMLTRPRLNTQPAIVPALTGVRALAAGMVFFYHWLFDEPTHWAFVPRALVSEGYLGVGIFFALSGFLITVRYAGDLNERRISYRSYLFKRFARIYPLYFVVMTLMVVVPGRPIGQAPADAWAAIVNYTLTQALFPSFLLSGVSTAWTLTIEEMFYLVAPALVVWFGGRGTAPLRKVMLRAGMVALAGLAVAVLLSQLPPLLPNTLFGAPLNYLLHYSIFGRMPDLLAGMALGFVYLQRDRFPALARRSPILIWAGLAGIVGGILLSHLAGSEIGSPANRATGAGVSFACAVLVLGMALDGSNRNVATRVFGSRLMVYLGKLSYGLYLIQLTEPCQWTYWIALGTIQDRIPHAVALYVITTLMCAVLYESVEKPAQRWLTRRRTVVARSAAG